jgi:hypothetical protein
VCLTDGPDLRQPIGERRTTMQAPETIETVDAIEKGVRGACLNAGCECKNPWIVSRRRATLFAAMAQRSGQGDAVPIGNLRPSGQHDCGRAPDRIQARGCHKYPDTHRGSQPWHHRRRRLIRARLRPIARAHHRRPARAPEQLLQREAARVSLRRQPITLGSIRGSPFASVSDRG